VHNPPNPTSHDHSPYCRLFTPMLLQLLLHITRIKSFPRSPPAPLYLIQSKNVKDGFIGKVYGPPISRCPIKMGCCPLLWDEWDCGSNVSMPAFSSKYPLDCFNENLRELYVSELCSIGSIRVCEVSKSNMHIMGCELMRVPSGVAHLIVILLVSISSENV